ncbi:hypothetical protein KQX54_000376 [Cotesia glomerata]|uniref:BED-type domain-containing protein n=1 Tax=Cotesia glomerata TaxID=32391 RepID=A0AAV7I603_COTGL|nr:hypothetical protein KQX54_000376 [Cotesia glomerata]
MSLTNSTRLSSATSSNTNDIEMTNGENPTISVVQVTEKRRAELAAECRKRPYLDGRYFEPDLSISSVKGTITGVCQLCKAKSIHRPIKGSFQTSSNYITHIQKVHADNFDADKEYVDQKRQKKNDEAEKMMRTY